MNLTPDQQEQLCKDVAEIKTALIGDSRYQQRGVVGDVADLKSWKQQIHDRVLYIAGGVAVAWFGICLAAYVGYEWVKTKLGNQ
jgi:hypothetical protein